MPPLLQCNCHHLGRMIDAHIFSVPDCEMPFQCGARNPLPVRNFPGAVKLREVPPGLYFLPVRVPAIRDCLGEACSARVRSLHCSLALLAGASLSCVKRMPTHFPQVPGACAE